MAASLWKTYCNGDDIAPRPRSCQRDIWQRKELRWIRNFKENGFSNRLRNARIREQLILYIGFCWDYKKSPLLRTVS